MTASREIAKAVLQWDANLPAIAERTSRDIVIEAIGNYRGALRPAHDRRDAEAQSIRMELAKAIGGIGNRIRPEFNEAQAKLWTTEMILALDHLPLSVALSAANEVRRMPLRHPSEVQPAILDAAGPILARHKRAMANLERLLREIDHPTPRLEAKLSEPMTEDELQSMPDALRSLGLAAGWLIEEPSGIRWTTEEEQDEHERRRAIERHSNAKGAWND